MAERIPVSDITYPYPILSDVLSERTRLPLKIPIEGPKPYNFLLVITHISTRFSVELSSKINRKSFVERTVYRLPDTSLRMPPACQHSTYAQIRYFTFPTDNTFLVAIDAVEGFFDDAGYFCLRYFLAAKSDVGSSISGGYFVPFAFKTTSFLLVVE